MRPTKRPLRLTPSRPWGYDRPPVMVSPRVPQELESRESVVLSADAVGYSRLMADDAHQTVRTLKAHCAVMSEHVSAHGGRVIDQVGDNLLADFDLADAAVACAAAIQRRLAEANAALPEGRRLFFRIGIHRGPVMVEERKVYGDTVNIAARLEALAAPGGVVLSEAVLAAHRNPAALTSEFEGERWLKNIPQAVRTHRLVLGTELPVVREGRKALADRPGVAVLRFENRSPDPEQDYLAEGVAEDLITRLGALTAMRVIARGSSFRYRENPPDFERIGRELGVRYVVDGSVRKAGQRIRLSVRLTEVASGEQTWAEHYDRELVDIFELQDEASRSIAASMHPELIRSETARAVRKAPENLDAWECILRGGWHLGRYSKEQYQQARKYLLRALSLDAQSVGARSLLAFGTHTALLNGWLDDPTEAIEEIVRLARQAVSLDARDADAQVTMGIAHLALHETDRALAAWKYATELDPNAARAHAWLGGTLAVRGSPDAAVEHIEAAIQLSPRDPAMWLFLDDGAFAHFVGRRYREAIDWAERSLRFRGERPRPYAVAAASHGLLGEEDAARSAAGELLRLAPDFSPREPGALLSHDADPSVATRLVQGLARAGLRRERA